MARYNVDLQDNEGNAYQIMANPDSVAEFSPAVNRENIRSGETYRVIFGKIMKYLSEVGNAAYVGMANNCTTTIAGFALDARQGKELMDRINELNRDLGGCSFEQKGDNFYIVGADSVRKKLAEPIFEKIGGMNPSSSSIPGYCKFDTGITGKVLWQSIFIVPMIIPASGSANNNLYNGGGITYDAKTGVITVNALYVKIVADIYYIID